MAIKSAERLRLSNIKDKDLLQHEIVRKKASQSGYKRLSDHLGFKDIKDMTNLAIRRNNIEALMGVAQSNIYAATAELSKPKYNQFFAQKYKEQKDNFIPQLYFMIRAHAPPQTKKMLMRLTRSIILRKTLNISGKGDRGKNRQRIRYRPGLAEFDLDATIFNYLQRGMVLAMDDIVGIERRQKKRNVVLILDTSGSMFGQLLLNAALTTSVLSYAMEKDNISVILFAGEPFVLKNINQSRLTHLLIDDILESEAVGFTNIERALKKGLEQLKSSKERNFGKSLGILITDGDYNRGGNPAYIAKQYPQLHVINMPPDINQKRKHDKAQLTCRMIAHAGRGHYYPVETFEEIPHALMDLLSKI